MASQTMTRCSAPCSGLDAAVSGAHLWIGPMGGPIVAMDCGSTNGSFLNDRYEQRLSQVAIANGDVVSINPALRFALVA